MTQNTTRAHLNRLFGVSLLTSGQQVLLAISGLLVVRGLPKTEYAQYAIVTAAIAAIATLADAGVVATLMQRGGRQVDELTQLLREARQFRVRSTAASFLAYLPVVIYLIIGARASTPLLLALVVAVALGGFAASASALEAAYLRLQHKYNAVAIVYFMSALLRLAAMASAIILAQTTWALELLVLALAILFSIAETRILGKLTHVPLEIASPSKLYASDFRRNARRQVPNSAFFVAQGLAVPLVLVAVGNPLSIADVNALSRFSLAFTVLASIITQLSMTVIARSHTTRRAIHAYVRASMIYLGAAGLALTLILVFSKPLLALLGPAYDGLETPFAIVCGGGALAGLGGVFISLNQSRGWLRLGWLQIPMAIAWLFVLLVFLTPTTTLTAALFSALVPFPSVLSMVICAVVGSHDEKRSRPYSGEGDRDTVASSPS